MRPTRASGDGAPLSISNGESHPRTSPPLDGPSSRLSLSDSNLYRRENSTLTSSNSSPCSSTLGSLSGCFSPVTPPPGGWVLKFLADNTSALGWMWHASRTRRPTIQNITRAYAALLTFSAPSTFTVQSEHIAGVDNDAADALSRPDQFPTWSSANTLCPELKPLQAYRLPLGLLSHLRWLVSDPHTGEDLETKTRKLLSLELTTLSPGARNADSATSLSRPRPKKRRRTSSRRTRKR